MCVVRVTFCSGIKSLGLVVDVDIVIIGGLAGRANIVGVVPADKGAIAVEGPVENGALEAELLGEKLAQTTGL